MIAFANPWALLGAIAIALPIAVHLLRRHRAARHAFPTLRFLPDARVVAVRRHRPTDVPLMIIRIAIVTAAVIALAQPVWRDAAAARASRPGLSRAVIVDRSSRMTRPSDDGRPAAERAAGELGRLSHADDQVLIDATDLHAGLAAASGWARRQAGDREIVVISSFAAGSLAATDVATVPQGVGLKLIAIPLALDPQPTGVPLNAHDDRDAPRSMTSRLMLGPGETSVSWLIAGALASPTLEWRARPEDGATLATVTSAALDIGVPTRAVDRPVVVVLPGAADRAALATAAVTIDTSWMFDAIRALEQDRLLTSVARTTTAVASDAPQASTPIIRDAGGKVLLAGARGGSGASPLLLWSNAPPGTLFTAALSAAIAEATRAAPWSALEPTSISSDELTRWQGPIGQPVASTPAADGAPLGRWLWSLALALLGLEWWWRRRPEPAQPSSLGAQRVA